MEVYRGIISTLEEPYDDEGNATKARVASADSGLLTRALTVPRRLRGETLTKGTGVLYVEYPDSSGAILMRTDGEEE